MNMNTIEQTTRSLRSSLINNSPSILTGLGVAGVITTTILGITATPKALSLLDNEKYKRRQEAIGATSEDEVEPIEIKPLEVIKLTWKCYIPTILMGGVTIVCIVGANRINLRRNAAIASLYSIADTTLRQYQEKVIETIGKSKEEKIHGEIAQGELNSHPVNECKVITTGKGDTLCFDSLSGRYFMHNVEAINRAINEFNRELLADRYLSLNEWYSILGLDETELGRAIGWDTNRGLLDVHYTSKVATDNRPCLVLEYRFGPYPE